MELKSSGKFAKKIGVYVATPEEMEDYGKVLPDHVSSGGTGYYSIEQLSC